MTTETSHLTGAFQNTPVAGVHETLLVDSHKPAFANFAMAARCSIIGAIGITGTASLYATERYRSKNNLPPVSPFSAIVVRSMATVGLGGSYAEVRAGLKKLNTR